MVRARPGGALRDPAAQQGARRSSVRARVARRAQLPARRRPERGVRDVLVPIRQRAIEVELSKRERRQEVLIEYLRDPISDAAAHTRDLGTVQGEIIELHTIYKNVKDRDELLAGVKKLRIPGDPARKCRCKKTRGGPCEHEQGA